MTDEELISRCYEHGQPDYILAAKRIKALRSANDTWVAIFGPMPESFEHYERLARNLAVIWANGNDGARTCILAALLKAARI